MPDITMCTGEKCEARVTCYRFLAKPNEHWQSYFIKPPDTNGGCEYYIKNSKK